MVDFATSTGKLIAECFIRDHRYAAFPQQSKTAAGRWKLYGTSTSLGKLCLSQCSDERTASLGTGGKSRHFIHAVSSRSADIHSASARRPRAQSSFTTQMSTRGDRQNNPRKPHCASTEIKQDVRRSGDWPLCFPCRFSPLECV